MITHIKENKTLFLAVLTYGIIAMVSQEQFLRIIDSSAYYFKELFQVIPLILFMTVVIDAWVPQSLIISKMGKDSGFMGPVYSLLIGSLSAGPIYAAFPVARLLLKKGASLSNISVVLSAWAVIKLPMLINEAKFLGWQFMWTRWGITVMAILLMGVVIGKVVSKEDVIGELSFDGTPEVINSEYCIGCGICRKMMPELFEMKDKKAVLSRMPLADEKGRLHEVSLKCPAKAIETT